MQYITLANQGVQTLSPYQAGKPIEELERELGVTSIVKLASNENPFEFPESAKQAIMAQLSELTRYPDSNGFYFKEIIAKKWGIDVEQITLGNGSNDLLELVARTFVGENDEIIFSQYAFIVYPLVTQAINAKASIVPAKDYGHDLDAFLQAITEKTKLIYIANPNNPTGTFLTHQQLAQFLAKVPEKVIVVLDEAYTEFTRPDERVDSFQLLQQHSNLVICRTLSKAYGLAGLRIGYTISNSEIADLFNRVRQPFNCNSLALAAAVAVFQDDDFIKKVAENNRLQMARYEQFFTEKKLAYIPSKANFITVDLKQPALPIYEKLLAQGVIVRPIGVYGLTTHLRISIGLPEENSRFFDVLSDILGY